MQRPESVIFVTEILGYTCAVASATCSILLIYAVFKHSPREMRSCVRPHRTAVPVRFGTQKVNSVLNTGFNSVCCGAFDAAYALCHPEALFPAPVISIGGVIKLFVLSEPLVRLIIYAVIMPLGGLVGSVLGMIVFRYEAVS